MKSNVAIVANVAKLPPKLSSVSSESTKALVRFLLAMPPLPSDGASAYFGRGAPFMVTFCFLRGNPLFPSW